MISQCFSYDVLFPAARAQSCALPEPVFLWRRLAQACFKHEKLGALPVLDLARIFLTPADSEGRDVNPSTMTPSH